MNAPADIDFSQFLAPHTAKTSRTQAPSQAAMILDFLPRLHAISGQGVEAINRLCGQEFERIDRVYAPYVAGNTLKNLVHSAYHNALISYSAIAHPSDLDPKTGQHFAVRILKFPDAFLKQCNDPSKAKSQQASIDRVPFELAPYLARIDSVLRGGLKEQNPAQVIAGITAALGPRLSESTTTGKITPITKYEVVFSGKLKSGDDGRRAESHRFCLADSALVFDAITWVRTRSDWAEFLDEDLPVGVAKNHYQSAIAKSVIESFGDVLPPLRNFDNETSQGKGKPKSLTISPRSLRRAFIACCVSMFRPVEYGPIEFTKQLLAHKSADSTAQYEKYYCVDSEGKPLQDGCMRHLLEVKASKSKLSETETQRPKVPAIVVSEIESGRFGDVNRSTSRAQQWVNLLETANRVQSVEAENAALKAEIEALKAQNERLQSQSQNTTQQSSNPATQAKPSASDLPSAQLFDSKLMKTPGTATARIERAIEAIQAFNSGLSPADKIAITPTVIQRVTGSRIGTIRDLLGGGQNPGGGDRPLTELGRAMADYNSYNGFGYHQNRGKDLAAVAEFVKNYG